MPTAKKVIRKSSAEKERDSTDFSGIEKRIITALEAARRGSTSVVYGRSGTGKTAFGGTFPKPILYVDTKERGIETIENIPDIKVIPIEEWIEFEQTYWFMRDRGHKHFKSVVIDQATALQGIGMTEIRRRSKKSEKEIFSQKNWGQLSGLLQTWLGNYRDLADLGTNICFIAHERSDGGGDDENMDNQIEPSISARLMPSVASYLNGAVSIIGHTFIQEKFVGPKKERRVKYCMRIGPHAFYTTKLRRPVDQGALPPFVVNPTFQGLMELRTGQVSTKRIVKRKK